MKAIERTITSNEVAEMVDRRHDQVLRDIAKIIEHLTEHKSVVSDLFIESAYQDSTGRSLPNYLLTKKGCELYATRMTGAKGTQFALAYIERFNQMENQLKEVPLPTNNTELLLETALKHERNLKVVNERLDKLETETTISSSQRRKIQGSVRSVVIKVLGGKNSNAYKNQSINKAAFSSCYNQLKAVFDVASYLDIPKARFTEAMDLIPRWQPTLELQARINQANGVSDLWETA
ncbi:ORF6C domain-containing protein [Enterococcus gallinarum]|uniref:ORF6C domain-containing protein n=1 Tax=Enterococcus TaxID=1350 RepID=UPI00100F20AE|nr:ORF6C domain-containing protein [Enterococcus faecalis]RXV98697.1 phage regulatory protein [Enterococcus faecalis]